MVTAFEALVIGVVGALVAIKANQLLETAEVDDPVGAIGVHGFSALWGLVSVGLFADSNATGCDAKSGSA